MNKQELEQQILYHADLYYNLEPEISDQEFDLMVDRLRKLAPDSEVLSKTGALSSGHGTKIKLDIPAGSLKELKEGDLIKWIKKDKRYIIANKLDGVSAILWYKKGELVQASSRGNGFEGSCVLRHVQQLKSIPKKLDSEIDCVIRGEIICSKENIPKMLEELKKETGKIYKNGRNTMSGFLNSKTGAVSIVKYAEFFALSIIENNDEHLTYLQQLDLLNDLNFKFPEYVCFVGNEFTEASIIERVKLVKEQGLYECDGLVIIENDYPDGYETGTIDPVHSRKFKLGAIDNEIKTEVVGIEWNISKDGYLKPLIQLKPKDIQGVTVSNATGNNWRFVVENRLGIGAQVRVIRSGDVIPKIVETISPSDDIPLPECEYTYSVNDDGEKVDLIYESGSEEMEEKQHIKNLVFFLQTLKIDQGGEGNVKILQKSFLTKGILTIESLLKFSKEDYEAAIGVNGGKLYESLHKKMKQVTEPEFFDAVQCFDRGIGITKLEKVYEMYGTLDVNEPQLARVEGFALKTVTQYLENINLYRYWKNWLKQNEFNFKKIEKVEGVLTGQGFCFTGVRSKEFEEKIQQQGGKICSGVTKDCTMLVVKSLDSTSSKMKKAKDMGIRIVTLEEAQNELLS